MATTFRDLKTRTLLLLDDTIIITGSSSGSSGSALGILEGESNSGSILKNAVDSALDAILPWYWKTSTYEFPTSGSILGLPTDFHHVESIYDANFGYFLGPTMLTPGNGWGSGMVGNGYILFPSGSITVSQELSGSGTLYYGAIWGKPTEDDDLLETPDYLNTALALYAASYCMFPQVRTASKLGSFKTSIDSGKPTDNPEMLGCDFFLKRFNIEMDRLPKMSTGVR